MKGNSEEFPKLLDVGREGLRIRRTLLVLAAGNGCGLGEEGEIPAWEMGMGFLFGAKRMVRRGKGAGVPRQAWRVV